MGHDGRTGRRRHDLGGGHERRRTALTTDSAELYRSLADADAMATSGYVAGGREPTAVRARYDDDIARATDRLVDAAGRLPGSGPVATVAAQLPAYTGLVETARTLNRLGLPLGQAYLGSASELMRGTILPAAEELRRQQAAELTEAYERGVAIPFAVGALLVATLVAIVDVSVHERRRTPSHRQRRAARRCGRAGGRADLVGRGRRRGERPAGDRAAAQRRRDGARRRAHRRPAGPQR